MRIDGEPLEADAIFTFFCRNRVPAAAWAPLSGRPWTSVNATPSLRTNPVRAVASPGEFTEQVVDLWSTSYVFRAGHRIRVQVTSSNFPAYRCGSVSRTTAIPSLTAAAASFSSVAPSATEERFPWTP